MSSVATPAVTRDRIPHPPKEAIDLATVMRTVGDPLRLDIVRLLADGRERQCSELADALDLPASTASYHLRLLREAGVTRTRAAGVHRLIGLRTDDLEDLFPGLLGVVTR